MIHIMYMTPTVKDAVRVGRLAKRLHGEDLERCIMVSPLPEEKPVYREPQFGRPRVQVHWMIATRNPWLAKDHSAWNRAVELYETRPYWLACLQSVWEAVK